MQGPAGGLQMIQLSCGRDVVLSAAAVASDEPDIQNREGPPVVVN